MNSYEEHFQDKTFLFPQPEITPYGHPSLYSDSKERLFGFIEGQNLLRDIYRCGGTPQAIRDAYVNAYGGFALDLPLWFKKVFKRLHLLQPSGKKSQTENYATLLDNVLKRADSDPTIDREIVAEFACQFLKAMEDMLPLDKQPQQALQIRIQWYLASQTIYTRERYSYQWALIQHELAKIYRHRAANKHSDDVEKAIQCYEEALQIITRNTAYEVCDLTDNNWDWAIMQAHLGKTYTWRLSLNTSSDRKVDLACAAQCYRAALSFFTSEISISVHRNILLDLAFLESTYGVAESHRQRDATALLKTYEHAAEAFTAARQANMEISWREYYLQNRVQQLVTWHGVRTMYTSHAWCLWKLGKGRDAVVALEEGRAHALAQAVAITHMESKGLCDFHAQKLEDVRSSWEEQLLKGNPDDIRKARQELLNLRNAIRDHCQQGFLPRETSYQNIIESPAPHQALIYITAAAQGGLAFVIPPAQKYTKSENRDPIVIALPKLTEQRVDDWFIRPDEDRRIIGGYQFAVQQRGVELLQQWLRYSMGDQQERERLLAIPLRDLPATISSPFTTLQVTLKNTIEAWQAQADEYSKQFSPDSQNKAHELYELLASPLQDGFARNVFSADLLFNWYLLEAELELLQQELSDTFIFDLRQELDHLGLGDPDQPIAFIPCGKLGMLPLHAAWARRSRWTGTPIPLAETCELTYQASARSLATAIKAIEEIKNLPQQGPIIAIGNPLPTKEKPLEWATAEANAIKALASSNGRKGSKAIVEGKATRTEIKCTFEELQKEGKPSGAWIHIAGHGHADPTDPKNCYMLLSDNETLTLADLQQRQFLRGVRGFIASGCTTALGDLEQAPDELISLAAGALQAGAPCAIATFWTVRDVAQFLLMQRFMRELLQNPSSTPAHALREATRWLRTVTHKQLADLAKKELEGIRSVPEGLTLIPDVLRGVTDTAEELTFTSNDTLRLSIKGAFSELQYISSLPYYTRTTHPIAHASCWAAVVMYGA